MIWIITAALWFTLFAGVYLLLSRNLLRCLFGLMMMSSAINLLVFASGRVGSALPPVITESARALTAQDANPIPQALVLTAIVIGFALTCFSLMLAMALLRSGSGMNINTMRTSEPEPTDPIKPPFATDASVLPATLHALPHAATDAAQAASATAAPPPPTRSTPES